MLKKRNTGNSTPAKAQSSLSSEKFFNSYLRALVGESSSGALLTGYLLTPKIMGGMDHDPSRAYPEPVFRGRGR